MELRRPGGRAGFPSRALTFGLAALLSPPLYRKTRVAYRQLYGTLDEVIDVYRRCSPLALTPGERVSLLHFSLRLFLARMLPGRQMDGDIAVRLHGVTHLVCPTAWEIYTLLEIYHDRYHDRNPDFVPKPGWVVFDIGANVGMYSVMQACRGARIYAFEPNRDCYRRLLWAITANDAKERVTPKHCAIGAVRTTGALHMPDRGRITTLGSVTPHQDVDQCPDDVDIVPLDQITSALPLNRIDLLKIDVEGAELEVLSGATETLKVVDRIVVEYHSQDLHDRLATLISHRGFEIIERVDVIPEESVGMIYGRRHDMHI